MIYYIVSIYTTYYFTGIYYILLCKYIYYLLLCCYYLLLCCPASRPQAANMSSPRDALTVAVSPEAFRR